VELETVDTEEELGQLKGYIEEHVAMTGSTVGEKVRGGLFSNISIVCVCGGV
jgi:glutamate synthase domain-containing protein 3